MDDQNKQFLMYAGIAAGWVVILYYIVFNSGMMFGAPSYSGLFISLVLAALVGAGVFFGMKKMAG